jgi:hypothetical protein
LRYSLSKRPAGNNVSDRDFVDIAPLHLGEKVAKIHSSSPNYGPIRNAEKWKKECTKTGAPLRRGFKTRRNLSTLAAKMPTMAKNRLE